MRIAFISKQYYSNIGGIEKVIENFRKSFSSKGHEVFVLNQNGLTKNLFKFNSKNFSLGFNLIFELNKLKPEIVHFHGFRIINFFPWIYCKLTKTPCIITPHFDYNRNLFREKINFFVHKLMNFNKIFALTLREESILKELGFKKIELIPDSVDTELFKQIPKSKLLLRKKLNLGKKSFIVLFLGRLASNKGIPYLINAFNEIKTKDKKLVIIGKENPAFLDTTYKYYESIAEKMHAKDVVFAGKFSEKGVIDAVNSVDVLVLPSISSEAFGLVLIEAMACGKPVIGTSIEGIKEVIVDGFNGFLVPPKKTDELTVALELLLNPLLRNKMGNNGLKLVKQKYSLTAVSEKHINAYFELIP